MTESSQFPLIPYFECLRLWGENTFGPAEASFIVERTEREMKELKEAAVHGWTPEAVEEAADVILVLTRAPGVAEALIRKHSINVNRDWERAGNGTGSHIAKKESIDV